MSSVTRTIASGCMLAAAMKLNVDGVQVSVLSYGSWVSFHNQVDVKQVRCFVLLLLLPAGSVPHKCE